MPAPTSRLTATPAAFFMALAFVNWLSFASWSALFANFTIEQAQFSWLETGLAQTVREIPGFLAFTAILWIALFREQAIAYVSLIVMAAGIGITGLFPSLSGVLLTTLVMSIGFHYYEAVSQSLQLQLLPKADAPRIMGRIVSAGAAAQFLAYGGLALVWWAGFRDYAAIYAVVGTLSAALLVVAWLAFERFQGPVPQRKSIVIRRRYWLYYAMQFMWGARRQIFIAFAGFLLVKKFGYQVRDMALLMLVTALLTTLLASQLGNLVATVGERHTLILENLVLICVFAGYATTSDHRVAAALFVADGVFFTLHIAQRAYIQKIADPADMAATSSVSFTINHIAAVVIPVCFGLLGMGNPSLIFWLGALLACGSLTLALMVPRHPAPGHETVLAAPAPQPAE
jgi:predicted MFS family arabinose efflux permease